MDHIKDIPIAKQLFTEIAKKGKPEKLQLFFEATVLDRYSQKEDVKVIRTDTSGRVSKRGVWSLDFGISGENDQFIHIPGEAFIHRLPEAERDHWLEHMVSLPISQNFIKGLIRPGCLDDGPIREW